jgi:hypothetical protein
MATVNVPKKVNELEEEKQLTVEALRAVVPRKSRSAITPKFVKKLNELVDDPEIRETFRNNVIGYVDILNEPHVSTKDYIQAVRYASYKLMDCTNQEAWIKTFPERYERMLEEGKSPDAIRAAVSAYAKGKVVNMVLEQSMIPVHIMNMDVYQKAVNTQAKLMMTAKSEKVRSDAANSLLTHLKPPESKKVDLSVNMKEDDSVRQLRNAVTDLARAQQAAIEQGTQNAKEIAEAKIIEGEFERE